MEEKETIVVENRRKFEDPTTGKKYYIAAPIASDVRGADWQYSKMYTQSLKEGIVTSAEMVDVLRIRGVIGPEFEQRQKELANELAVRVETLRATMDMEEKQNLALEVASLRQELYEWNYRLNGPMSNTCEQIADDARLEYLTAMMVQLENGEKVWEEYSDFLKEKNQGFSMRARFEIMLYLQGLESNFLEQTPEATAIREIEEEIQSKASEALARLEKSVAEMDKAEDVEEKKPKPAPKKRRSTRKPTKKKVTSEQAE
jgi:hypothetical protein